MIKINSTGLSRMGTRHQINDDSIHLNEKEGIYIICDGVSEGGNGKTAAEIVIKSINEILSKANSVMKNSKSPLTEAKKLILMQDLLAEAFAEAQSVLVRHSEKDPSFKVFGTTCITVWMTGRFAIIGHLGDSRAYLIRNGKTHQLTKDHCGLEEMLKMGMDFDAARKSPFARHLTRAFGHSQFNRPDLLKIEFQPRDSLILCTDGIHSTLNDKQNQESFFKDLSERKDINKWMDFFAQRSGDDASLIQINFDQRDSHNEDEPTLVGIRAADRIELIKRTPLSKYLDFSQKCHIAAICDIINVKSGTVIIEEGKIGDKMYIVANGLTTLSNNNQFIRDSKEGEFFGEIGLIKKQNRTATLTAKTDSSLLSISKDDLEEVFKKDPSIETRIYKALLETVLERFIDLNNKVTST